MKETSLSEFFANKQVNILQDSFAIKSMDQLLALKNTSIDLDGLAKAIKLKLKVFFSILDEAEKTIPVARRSKRKYTFGVHDGAKSTYRYY